MKRFQAYETYREAVTFTWEVNNPQGDPLTCTLNTGANYTPVDLTYWPGLRRGIRERGPGYAAEDDWVAWGQLRRLASWSTWPRTYPASGTPASPEWPHSST